MGVMAKCSIARKRALCRVGFSDKWGAHSPPVSNYFRQLEPKRATVYIARDPAATGRSVTVGDYSEAFGRSCVLLQLRAGSLLWGLTFFCVHRREGSF